MTTVKTKELFDLSHTLAKDFLSTCEYPWLALPGIKDLVLSLGSTLPAEEYDNPEPGIWIAKDVKIAKTATICPPTIIGKGTEVRPGAYIRGSVLVGEGCVVGNSCELKNVILFDGVQVPHFNYVGDSMLGKGVHLGAGAICSNLRSDKKNVVIKGENLQIETGLRKLGAILGDGVEIGCGAILNPGTVIGKNSTVYPLTLARGIYPGNSIVKNTNIVVSKEEFFD